MLTTRWRGAFSPMTIWVGVPPAMAKLLIVPCPLSAQYSFPPEKMILSESQPAPADANSVAFVPHLPALHPTLGSHGIPHPPQLSGSAFTSTHTCLATPPTILLHTLGTDC